MRFPTACSPYGLNMKFLKLPDLDISEMNGIAVILEQDMTFRNLAKVFPIFVF